jgi:hypothetical protein
MAQNGLNPPLRRRVTLQLSAWRITRGLSAGISWLRDKFNYIIFKFQQYRQKAKARRNDPNIYPFW